MYKHLLAPTDGSELSMEGVRQAASLAKWIGASVTLLYVQPKWPMPFYGQAQAIGPQHEEFVRNASATANEVLLQASSAVEAFGMRSKCCKATSDEPWQVIIDTAKREHCDLIVMASHGRSGLAGLLIGSQTQKVLTHCKVPVLVCR